jgi:DNA-binding GntR family transcriptional regulator
MAMADGEPANNRSDKTVNPPVREGGTVLDVRNRIREAIMLGELKSGEALTSGRLAEAYGVSRTPLREALRMLQEEGFVTFEQNKRPRVSSWSPEELETVFTQRIMLTALCTRLTVPRLTSADISAMEGALAELETAGRTNDVEAWRTADVAFHRLHMAYASVALVADLHKLTQRATMFRFMWVGQRSAALSFSLDDHPEILEACRIGDVDRAAAAAAGHLARVALTLLANASLSYEPTALREALRQVSAVR